MWFFTQQHTLIWMGRSRVWVRVIPKTLKMVLTAPQPVLVIMSLIEGNALAIKRRRQRWYNSKSWLSYKMKGYKTYKLLSIHGFKQSRFEQVSKHAFLVTYNTCKIWCSDTVFHIYLRNLGRNLINFLVLGQHYRHFLCQILDKTREFTSI